jgi:hypothetical protein
VFKVHNKKGGKINALFLLQGLEPTLFFNCFVLNRTIIFFILKSSKTVETPKQYWFISFLSVSF